MWLFLLKTSHLYIVFKIFDKNHNGYLLMGHLRKLGVFFYFLLCCSFVKEELIQCLSSDVFFAESWRLFPLLYCFFKQNSKNSYAITTKAQHCLREIFLKFYALHYSFFSLGNFSYRLCILFHTYIDIFKSPSITISKIHFFLWTDRKMIESEFVNG